MPLQVLQQRPMLGGMRHRHKQHIVLRQIGIRERRFIDIGLGDGDTTAHKQAIEWSVGGKITGHKQHQQPQPGWLLRTGEDIAA